MTADLIVVAAGAGIGAVCRAAVDRGITARVGPTRLPWATLLVNVLGTFVLGLVLGATEDHIDAGVPGHELAHLARLALGVGFAGGLTTFSTFSWESWSLLHEGRPRAALGYAALTVGLGMMAVVAGMALGSALA